MVLFGYAMDGTQLKAQYKTGERNFRGIVLPGVNLVWVELKGIDLRGADLSQSNLSGADLSGSDLSQNTNLAFTDLSRADLRNTNLKGARLEGANLEGVQLEGAVYDENTKFPRGFDPQLVGGIPGGSLAQKAEPKVSQIQTSTLQKPEPKKPPLQPSTTQKPKPNKQFKPGTKAEKTEAPRQHELDLSISSKDSEQYAPNTQSRELQEDLPASRSYQFGQPFNLQSVNPGLILSRFYRSLKASKTSDRPKNVEGLTQQVKEAVTSTNDWHQTQPADWTLTPAQPSEILPNSSGQGKTSLVPVGIKRWNWGAFLLPWFWFIPNQVWGVGIALWLLSLLPYWNILFAVLFAIAFGLKGNEWAWKARPWDSPEAFRKHQQVWAIAGFFGWGLIIFIILSSKR
jgi:Pentapeptide repeats (8 copies)